MYKSVLQAYDGSLEGRTALREGALLARQCGAQVFLLAVLVDTGISLLADVAHAGAFAQMENAVMDVLNEGVARLKQLGFDPVAKLGRGEPAEVIGTFAREIAADLIVVGHRRQSAFDRWWSEQRLDGFVSERQQGCDRAQPRRDRLVATRRADALHDLFAAEFLQIVRRLAGTVGR